MHTIGNRKYGSDFPSRGLPRQLYQASTDVVKDLCFCAKVVGVGRAALYELGISVVKGVERIFELQAVSRRANIRIITSRD
jgi:hypothetical protein